VMHYIELCVEGKLIKLNIPSNYIDSRVLVDAVMQLCAMHDVCSSQDKQMLPELKKRLAAYDPGISGI
jgi:hypothetical protein